MAAINSIRSTQQTTPSVRKRSTVPPKVVAQSKQVAAVAAKSIVQTLDESLTKKHAVAKDINDSVQALVRMGMGEVEKALQETSPAVAKMIKSASFISNMVCGTIIVTSKAFEFKAAVAKLPVAFKFGGVYEKIDALIAFIRTLSNLITSGGGLVTSAVGSAVLSAVLKIPLLILRFLNAVIWICRAISRMVRIGISLHTLNKVLALKDPKESWNSVFKFFHEAKKRINESNAQIRAEHGDSPELDKFLEDRRKLRLTHEFGSYAEDRIFAHFKGDEDSFESIQDKLYFIEMAKQAPDANLVALKAKEDELLKIGLSWAEGVKSEMKTNIAHTVPILLASLLGFAALIIGLVTLPTAVPVGLILGALATICWLVVTVIFYFRSHQVTDNQKRWVTNLIVRDIIKEAKTKSAEELPTFTATYGHAFDSVAAFKEYLQGRVKRIENKISYTLITLLKEYDDAKTHDIPLTAKQLTNLHEEFSKLFDLLVTRKEGKRSKERSLLPFIRKLVEENRLHALASNLSFDLYRFRLNLIQ